MNPQTGEFHEDDGSLPEDWPRFEVGEKIVLCGCIFQVKHIDTERHELVLVHHSRYEVDEIAKTATRNLTEHMEKEFEQAMKRRQEELEHAQEEKTPES